MVQNKLNDVAQKEEQRLEGVDCRIYCCASTGCLSSGSETIAQALSNAAISHEVAERVSIVRTGCMGLCSQGPLIRVEVAGQKPVLYVSVDPMLARLVFAEHVLPAMAHDDEEEPFRVPPYLLEHTLSLEHPFFTRQAKVVLGNSGSVDPERIEDYIHRGGYRAFERVLTTMTPEEVVEQVARSGLRGRGGGGYRTGTKWRFAAASEGEEKFLICNGDEGDPGAYMDRSILEGDPHAVLEGMLIGAYATGATEGWFYIRAEYPLAVERVEKAIKAARRNKLLGKNILGTDFSFTCEVRLGAGAFVCGEETALIHSIEGQRGTPRPRPPYPTQSGLWGQPSCVNNVETLANVPRILDRGPDWFASMGTETSKGTKVFALTGKVRHSGLIEVPMGITLREVVEQIGGGSSTDKKLKAVQTGGPSGGVIPTEELDLPICYEELTKMGSMMGSGGMIALDEDDGMVDIAAFYLKFTVDESCGKCAPCRVGGVQMVHLLEKVLSGKATLTDIDTIRRLARAMQKASLCGLGQTAANPVVSTLKYFPQEYLDRIDTEARPETHDWEPLKAVR